mgnify:CR=1 FL=1
MAQLKVKQISDFVSAVGSIHDATVGTAAGTAIAGVQSDVDVNTEAIALNTAKVGITTEQSSAIVANSAKVGITTEQSSAIVANTAKVGITTEQSSAIVANSAKVGITEAQSSAIVANSAKVGITEAQSSAIVANTSGIATEKARIDALLQDSTTALDTFAEIVNFIGELDTADIEGLSAALSTSVSNDAIHASGISANATAISNLDTSAQGYADTAEANAIAAAEAKDVVRAEAAKSYADGLSVNYDAAGDADTAEANAIAAAEAKDVVRAAAANAYAESLAGNYDAAGDADTAEANAIAAAKTYTDGRETAITTAYQSYADTAEADAIASANSHTDTEIAALDLRIDGLEGASFEEVVANFVDITGFSSGVQFNLDNVKVFVNGLQIHEAAEGIDGWRSADGLSFTVEGLGYDLEADDHIIVSGRLA